jgi:hypothetical protein
VLGSFASGNFSFGEITDSFFYWAPFVEDAELGILFASTALWIINVLFPALLGWILILKTDFRKRLDEKRI